ncbi:MAG TPA: HAD family phosphatase [Acidimicrobiales bacterium]|jgi:putative hydrolase of the HAD superfamily|nr:HAD family phosphatase [Acidimicrobiales bacterium]
MTRWLLLDYGQVLSEAPPADEWAQLQEAAGYRDADSFYRTYWEHRGPYDRGDLSFDAYWDLVAPGRTGDVKRLDNAIWLHPHQPSVDAALASRKAGWRLAILSNAPVEVAKEIDRREWLRDFEIRFFSCHLRRVKPEPEIYADVLAGLSVEAPDVVFFDDRQENVDAARRAGIDGRLFTRAEQLVLPPPRP